MTTNENSNIIELRFSVGEDDKKNLFQAEGQSTAVQGQGMTQLYKGMFIIY